MAYEVLARKWRPQHFEDVLGQEHVTRTLVNAIESKRIAHAYLFVGPRGIGKTTLSRIFAKALNCSASGDATAHPCDKCDNCREIMAGTSLDVVEIDAASNNGVDNIRDLRSTVQFTPASSRYKVFIIDEVHMLSTGAFNALLKTLEEPPPHVKFIFATTEFDKLPSTIVSRCQRFDLRRIPTALIVRNLSRICASEGVAASEDALLAVARGAEGGMRDALSALDQLISFKGDSIAEQDVVSVFGLVSRGQIADLTTAVLKGDMAAGLKIIDVLDRNGKDLRRLVVEMLEHFRNVIVRQQLGDAALPLLDATPDQLKTIDEQASLADTARILRVAELFADLENRIRFALSRRTIFETVFLRACRAATTVTLDGVIRQLSMAVPADAPQAQPEAAPVPGTGAAGVETGRPPSRQAQAAATARAAQPSSQAGARGPSLREALFGDAGPRRPGTGEPAATVAGKSATPAATPATATPTSPTATATSAATPATAAPSVSDAADLSESPIRAANEPAIRRAMQIFGARITAINPPTARIQQEALDDSDDAEPDADAAVPDVDGDDPMTD